MTTFLIIIFTLILLVGILGCVIPAIPGPPLAYIAVLSLSLLTSYKLSDDFLVMWAGIVIAVTALDLWLQVYGVKKLGGKKKAINGTIIGLIVGLLAPIPFGFIIGPFAGAFIGARMEEEDLAKVFKIAFGALLGFLSGTILKLAVSAYLALEFFKVLWHA